MEALLAVTKANLQAKAAKAAQDAADAAAVVALEAAEKKVADEKAKELADATAGFAKRDVPPAQKGDQPVERSSKRQRTR